jgi:hypothetical protein
MTDHSITLVIPGRPMNRNGRHHWRAKAKLTKQLRNATVDYAWEQWGPRTRTVRAVQRALGFTDLPPAHITIADHCRTANLRDVENADVKPVVDGLTDYGLWPDDGPRYVGGMTRLPPVKTGTDELVLTITWTVP